MIVINIDYFFKSPDQINIDLANRVRTRRKEQKISQMELSKRSDVSLGSIKRFETIGEISLSSLIKIALALGYEDDFELLFAKRGYSSIQEVIDERK